MTQQKKTDIRRRSIGFFSRWLCGRLGFILRGLLCLNPRFFVVLCFLSAFRCLSLLDLSFQTLCLSRFRSGFFLVLIRFACNVAQNSQRFLDWFLLKTRSVGVVSATLLSLNFVALVQTADRESQVLQLAVH